MNKSLDNPGQKETHMKLTATGAATPTTTTPAAPAATATEVTTGHFVFACTPAGVRYVEAVRAGSTYAVDPAGTISAITDEGAAELLWTLANGRECYVKLAGDKPAARDRLIKQATPERTPNAVEMVAWQKAANEVVELMEAMQSASPDAIGIELKQGSTAERATAADGTQRRLLYASPIRLAKAETVDDFVKLLADAQAGVQRAADRPRGANTKPTTGTADTLPVGATGGWGKLPAMLSRV